MTAPAPIYLDANASEPLRAEAAEAALAAMRLPGNPASIHGAGRAARAVLEAARLGVADAVGARKQEVVFTSGGTEADALAIASLGQGRRLLVSAVEHAAVFAAARDAVVIPVDVDGVVELAALERLLAGRPTLVCVMLANNETGVVQPVGEVARLCRAAGALLHVDAVQAAGRIPVDMGALGADSIALSGHKLGGPKGAGALVLAPGREVVPMIRGGGQERGRRGGTPALPAIAGFAAALGCRPAELAPLRDALEAGALACHAAVLGAGAPRLPNTSCLALPGVAAEAQVIALDLAGVAVSAGAACSSGKVARSHVLEAMGAGALAGQAIRVSLPWNATASDVRAFAAAYAGLAQPGSRAA